MWNQQLIYLLRYAAIAGNSIFVVWMLYNGINEGFKGTVVEKLSYIGLTVLLAINTFFLLNKSNKVA